MSFNFTSLSKAFLLLIIPCLSSCELISKAEDIILSNKDEYTILKGQHFSKNSLKQVKTTKLRFEARFDKSAIYSTVAPNNQGDINKLYGLSDCNSFHHTNSARFGWRWFNNKLEIHAYVYNNKQRISKLLTTVELDQTYTYELILENDQYVFLLNDSRVALPRNCSGSGEGYLLYPYFGGDEVAPHNITIRLKSL